MKSQEWSNPQVISHQSLLAIPTEWIVTDPDGTTQRLFAKDWDVQLIASPKPLQVGDKVRRLGFSAESLTVDAVSSHAGYREVWLRLPDGTHITYEQKSLERVHESAAV